MLLRTPNSHGGWRYLSAFLLACVCLLGPAPAALGKSDRISQLARLLKYPDPVVRKEAIGEMAKINDPHAVKHLVAMLKDEDRSVRESATDALGDMKAEAAVKPLVGALRDPDPYVRAWADTALIKIGPASVLPLTEVLKDSDPYVPALSALALSQIKDPRAASALITVLNDHNVKAILGVHTYFVKLGRAGSESALIEALGKYPTKTMAKEFLNSGNPVLQEAANAWARKYKQKIGPPHPEGAIRWGSGV